ncbi:hypothetical protein EYR38_003295 [Pleurotus pulmonarius]|nr:hypothetical protein EYR38_003295 [Pleurotus pulmonarius]
MLQFPDSQVDFSPHLVFSSKILFQRRNTDDSDSPDAPPEPPSLVVLSLRSGNVALTREIDRESSGDGEGVEWKLQTPMRPESKPELESKSELKSKSELTRSLRSSDGGENEWAGAVAWEDFHALAVQHYCGEQTLELVNTHDRAAITVRVQVSTASPSSSIEGAECRRLTTAPHQGSQQPETRECADTRRPRSRYLFCAMPDEDDLFDMEACGYRYADVQPPTDSPDAVFPPKSDGAPRDSAKIHWRDYYQTVVSYAFIAIDDADTIFKIRTPEGLEAMTRVVEGSKGVHSIFCTDAMTSIDLGHISPS